MVAPSDWKTIMTAIPPENLEQLRREYASILKASGRKKLGRRSLEVLKHMLNSPHSAAVRSISQLAADVGVSTSVITRMAQKLGYGGFPALQAVFRGHVNERTAYYSGQVERFLEQHANRPPDSEEHPLQRTVRTEWPNVIQSLELFDPVQYANAATLLEESENVYVMGLRSSYPVANFLAYYLKTIRRGVRLFDTHGNVLAEDLVDVGEGDLLFAISVHPYTRLTVDACRLAKERGAEVVALTDSQSSPLANEADNVLIISAASDSWFSSITAANLYVTTLLSELVARLGSDAVSRLRENELLLHGLGIECD